MICRTGSPAGKRGEGRLAPGAYFSGQRGVRRSLPRPAELLRRNRPARPYDWGDDPRPAVCQWRYWLFLVGWACTVAIVVHLAIRGRGL